MIAEKDLATLIEYADASTRDGLRVACIAALRGPHGREDHRFSEAVAAVMRLVPKAAATPSL
jgi:hypothetical protein